MPLHRGWWSTMHLFVQRGRLTNCCRCGPHLSFWRFSAHSPSHFTRYVQPCHWSRNIFISAGVTFGLTWTHKLDLNVLLQVFKHHTSTLNSSWLEFLCFVNPTMHFPAGSCFKRFFYCLWTCKSVHPKPFLRLLLALSVVPFWGGHSKHLPPSHHISYLLDFYINLFSSFPSVPSPTSFLL